jgi:hypothetical protein
MSMSCPMPSPLPPGIAFLAPRLPFLFAPPVLVLLVCRLAQHSFDIAVPIGALVFLVVLSWPLVFVAHNSWSQWRIQRKAAAVGAVVPAMVDHKLPGAFDLIQQFVADRKNRFLSRSSLAVWLLLYPLRQGPLSRLSLHGTYGTVWVYLQFPTVVAGSSTSFEPQYSPALFTIKRFQIVTAEPDYIKVNIPELVLLMWLSQG